MGDVNKELRKQISEIIDTTFDYVANGIPLIKNLGSKFHQGPNKEAWNQLADLLDGVSWILETVGEIDSINNLQNILEDYKTWNEYFQSTQSLNEIIKEITEALQNEDNVSIADLLLYEIVPVFERMLEKLDIMLPRVLYGIEN